MLSDVLFMVSRKFNEIGGEMLNRGYYMVERFHRKSLKAVKSKLPRRESERKIHPLSRQCDVLVAVETRLSMLSMTFIKYIEARLCCFIPGKVIDELLRVLRLVNTFVTPPHDILQELRDITSMAMEHFDEKIVPHLKDKLVAHRANASSLMVADYVGTNRTCCLSSNLVTYKNLFSVVRQNLFRTKSNRNFITCISLRSKRITKRIKNNSRLIQLLKNKVGEQRREINKLRRVVQNWEAKFRDLSSELRGLRERSGLSSFSLSGDNIEEDNVTKVVTRNQLVKKRKL
ncbi:F-box protein pallbearer isoform X2 [Lycorma delicatula]|uniref:F-box protein pallbearer isoform X2 n=1 Tax=Lycorma delicatula TaxID=130591 RepID=UPI003F515CA9